LDHIWTNENKITEFRKTVGISDHDGTFVKISLEREIPKTEKITIRNFKNYNDTNFSKDLENKLKSSEINKLIAEKETNKATIELTKIIKETLDVHAPFIEILPKEKNIYIPWYNEELKEKIKKELLKDCRIYGRNLFKERLKKITNKITFLKNFLKQKYILDELEKAGEDPKKIWKVLNFLVGKKETPEKIEPEEINQDKVNKYNEFFATIGVKIEKELNTDLDYT